MHIVCSQCLAEYNLDDDKISDDGVLVRCPKCQNTFRVKGHGASVVVSSEEVAEPAAADSAKASGPDETSPPAAAQDAGPSPFDEEAPSPEAAPESPDTEPGDTEPEKVEPEDTEPEDAEAGRSYDFPDKPVTEKSTLTQEIAELEESDHFFESFSSDMEYEYTGRSIAWKILPVLFIGVIVAAFLIPQLRKPLTATITDVSWRIQEYLFPPSPLVIEGIDSKFIQNHRGSVLFVAEGHVRNRSNGPIQCPMIMARLYDTSGAEIHKSVAHCGRVLRTEELRTFGRSRIREMFEPSDGGKSLSKVQAGHSIPFMIVFYDIPEGAMEFEIEVLENPVPYAVTEKGQAFRNGSHPRHSHST